MLTLNDIQVIEGEVEADELEFAKAMQRAINSGMWGLQGSYGRGMMRAIEAGEALLGRSGARDFFGNYIPSRDEVQPGTKGSREFVVECMGEEHAAAMEGV